MSEIERMSDRELLLSVHQDVGDIRLALWGNGRPGALDRLTTLEAKVEERTGTSKATLVGSGSAGALVMLLLDFIRSALAKG